MGEGATAVAVAESEDAGNAGAELIIDRDEAVLVRCEAGGCEIEVVGVGRASNGEEDVGAFDVGFAFVAIDADGELISALLEMNAGGFGAGGDAFGVEDFADDGGGIFVFIGSEAGASCRRW